MANLYRLIVGLLLAMAGTAFAQQQCFRWESSTYGYVSGSSYDSVCSAAVAKMGELHGTPHSKVGGTEAEMTCVTQRSNGLGGYYTWSLGKIPIACPTCPKGWISVGGGCLPVCSNLEGKSTGVKDLTVSLGTVTTADLVAIAKMPDYLACHAGPDGSPCQVLGIPQMPSSLGGQGVVNLQGTIFTGLGCDPNEAPVVGSAKPSPVMCQAGQCPGQVNGVDVCVPCSFSAAGSTASGSGTSTTSGGTGTSVTSGTTSVTVCDGNKCTTSTTTSDTSSSSTGTGTNSVTITKTQDQGSFCKENPTSPLCVSGSFSGSCNAAFQCSGDAVQCATAKAANEMACLMAKDGPEKAVYDAAKTKTGNQTTNLPGNETFSVSGSIDQSDAIGGASCIGNLTVTVWNRPVTLPLSDLCTWLGALGNLLVAVSMLTAGRIVVRG